MRKLVVAALGSMVFATPALAEDGDWTGPYVGVSAGWNSAHSDSSATLGGQWAAESAALRETITSNMAASQTSQNGDVGAFLGYNYQSGGFVAGLELEANAIGGQKVRATGPITTGVVGSAGNAGNANPALAPNYTFTNSIDPKSMIAIKLRLGAAMGDTLFYVNGGWAWVDANQSASIISNGNYKKSATVGKTRNGWLLGLGIEQRLGTHLSLRASYDYTDQGDFSYVTAYEAGSSFTTPAYTETINQDLTMHLVRIGLSYHF
jgi:opacity protein-like surface antigen